MERGREGGREGGRTGPRSPIPPRRGPLSCARTRAPTWSLPATPYNPKKKKRKHRKKLLHPRSQHHNGYRTLCLQLRTPRNHKQKKDQNTQKNAPATPYTPKQTETEAPQDTAKGRMRSESRFEVNLFTDPETAEALSNGGETASLSRNPSAPNAMNPQL